MRRVLTAKTMALARLPARPNFNNANAKERARAGPGPLERKLSSKKLPEKGQGSRVSYKDNRTYLA